MFEHLTFRTFSQTILFFEYLLLFVPRSMSPLCMFSWSRSKVRLSWQHMQVHHPLECCTVTLSHVVDRIIWISWLKIPVYIGLSPMSTCHESIIRDSGQSICKSPTSMCRGSIIRDFLLGITHQAHEHASYDVTDQIREHLMMSAARVGSSSMTSDWASWRPILLVWPKQVNYHHIVQHTNEHWALNTSYIAL